jgi:RNA polymerase sigma factor (sigma-70 family)
LAAIILQLEKSPKKRRKNGDIFLFEGLPRGARFHVRMHVMTGDVEQLLLHGEYEETELARALLDTYYAQLYSVAFSILKDSAEADDVVQETLLTALNKIERYEPGTDLKGWLCRIAINRCRDALRRRKVRKKWYGVWARVAALGAPPRTPERRTADHELAGELWQAVDDLNDRHRLPLILHYVHGMTAPEIAEILNIREGTGYSRLFYACRKLESLCSDSELERWAEELFNE